MASWRALRQSRLLGVLLLVALGLLWEASSRSGAVKSETWPALSAVFVEAWRGLASLEIVRPLASTLRRSATGLGIGAALGIGLGLVSGLVPFLFRMVNPLIELMRPVPAPAIIPPLILLLGVDDGLKVFVVSLAVFYPMYVNTVGGARDVPDVLINTARTFRVGRLRTLRQVMFPATLPAIFSGLRIGVGLSLIVGVIAEMIAGSEGIGYFIVESQYSMRPATMYAAIAYLAASGYLLNRGLARLEEWTMPWARTGRLSLEKF